MGKVIHDDKIGKEMWQHAQDLKATYVQRDKDFEEYERMYLMKFPDNAQFSDYKNNAACTRHSKGIRRAYEKGKAARPRLHLE